MATYSPYRSTPGGEFFYDDKGFPTPSPTPSPRGPSYYFGTMATPQRPSTRAHFRTGSTTGFPLYGSPRASFSPRYTSDGLYGTVNVSHSHSRTRKHSFSGLPSPRLERRRSFSYIRPSDRHGESDEEEFLNASGASFTVPARSTARRHRDFHSVNAGGHGTDHHRYAQGGPYFDREAAGFASPWYEPDRRPQMTGHPRRNSTSVPQMPPRPQTARPASVHRKPPPPPPHRQATEADAKRYKIPPGYSLKNWDPSEEPILLLGSVFDANSLGKWIYDWTVYHHGPNGAFADMAGELWLLLIQLAGKRKRAEEIIPKIRSKENREMVEEFIQAGERISDKLRKLLKACEAPMLRSATKDGEKAPGQLGKDAGVEFVETLFGRDRELERTEKFMSSLRTWNLRFDTNCEEILRKPTV
ncbi:uncharacterized protein CTHT_0044550 [Thermochaetoides thermophila DSM 1495]|uniref:Uncharacterized protein n=1 Tax=Chaetomium thermophilum (strain DSM 1495 / CBS 144.50 / IMI 039719) TaxID=759272 RepID=G0S949_CHATD|nr:hypothetical protein CTHT_0044550 [Thermochaetoides thermophila DSM 1495]EGS19960.1 hypothetical protein CTHT_0044550 [Thermochaetoides thermophila DSM 1495]